MTESEFNDLYHRYRKLVHSVCWKVYSHCADQDSLSQNVWLRVWTHREQLIDLSKARQWITSIAHTEALQQFRRDRARMMPDAHDEIKETCRTARSPEEEIIARLTLSKLQGKLAKPLLQEVIRLRLSGNEIADTAQRLNIPIGTVSCDIHRAKKAMRAAAGK